MDLAKLFTELKKQIAENENVPSPRTAVLWGHEDLLGGAVEALLTSQCDWRVIRIFDERDIEALTREVELVKPELMIVNRNSLSGDLQPLLALVQSCSALKIITVNPENNLIEVYDKHLVQLNEIGDLLSIIDLSG